MGATIEELESFRAKSFADGQFVAAVPVELIAQWVGNPRKVFDDVGLQELVDSIRQDGIQQPIVVRETDPDHWEVIPGRLDGMQGYFIRDKRRYHGKGHDMVYDYPMPIDPKGYFREDRGEAFCLLPIFDIVMGERRYRAAKLAGLTHVPCIVRVGMDDRTALRLAVVENLKRRDLNPIEEADGYRALIDAGYQQREIAEQVGVTEGTLSNALRLRKLPAPIRQMVVEGKLSGSHARALLRFEGFEAAQIRMATLAFERGMSAREMEKGIPFAAELLNAKIIASPKISKFVADILSACQQCPFNAARKSIYDEIWCFKPEHMKELEKGAEQKQAEALKVEQARVDAERKRILEQAKVESVKSAAVASVESFLGPSDTESDKTDAQTPEEPTVPTLDIRTLPYQLYQMLTPSSPAPCIANCTECPCRVAVRGYQEGSVLHVCMDLERHQSIKRQMGDVERNERKERLHAEEARVLSEEVLATPRALSALIFDEIDNMNKVPRVQLQAWLRGRAWGVALADLLDIERHNRRNEANWETFANLTIEQQIEVAIRGRIVREIDGSRSSHMDADHVARWLFESTPAPVPTPEEIEAAWDEESEDTDVAAICEHCGDEISANLLHHPVIETTDYGQVLETGVFVGKAGEFACKKCYEETEDVLNSLFEESKMPEIKILESPPPSLPCPRCHDRNPADCWVCWGTGKRPVWTVGQCVEVQFVRNEEWLLGEIYAVVEDGIYVEWFYNEREKIAMIDGVPVGNIRFRPAQTASAGVSHAEG